jgi:phage shock protein A
MKQCPTPGEEVRVNHWKRWTLGMLSRIDALVTRVENHDALVTAALSDLRQATARAQVQLKRVRRDGETLSSRLTKARAAVIDWQARAKRSLDDEARALACLRRRKDARREVTELERRLEVHARAEDQLAQDIRVLEERLRALSEQRNLMRTRQSRAEALRAIQGRQVELSEDLEDVFERWETRLAEAELASGCPLGSGDTFEAAFVRSEEDAELRSELQALRGSEHG